MNLGLKAAKRRPLRESSFFHLRMSAGRMSSLVQRTSAVAITCLSKSSTAATSSSGGLALLPAHAHVGQHASNALSAAAQSELLADPHDQATNRPRDRARCRHQRPRRHVARTRVRRGHRSGESHGEERLARPAVCSSPTESGPPSLYLWIHAITIWKCRPADCAQVAALSLPRDGASHR